MKDFKVKIFADGADLKSIFQFAKLPFVKGITTNPSLMRQSGVENYRSFAGEILEIVKDIPVSFEVFADEMDEMYQQANDLSKLAGNVFVKIPIVNSRGKSTSDVISALGKDGVKLNITAIMTTKQIEELLSSLNVDQRLILSIFSGRIADTGRDPCQIISSAVTLTKDLKNTEILWASTREVYNIVQANQIGCHIITMPYVLIKKLDLFEKNLDDYSRETAETFYLDAKRAGYMI